MYIVCQLWRTLDFYINVTILPEMADKKFTIISIVDSVQDNVLLLNTFYSMNKGVEENIQVKRLVEGLAGFLKLASQGVSEQLSDGGNRADIVVSLSKEAIQSLSKLQPHVAALKNLSENQNIQSVARNIQNIFEFLGQPGNASFDVRSDEALFLKAKIFEVLDCL